MRRAFETGSEEHDPTANIIRHLNGESDMEWIDMTRGIRRLKRCIFHSLVDLQAAINRTRLKQTHNPKLFTWTADPDLLRSRELGMSAHISRIKRRF